MPKCVLLFSGKRKCGKDYFTDKLFEKLNHSDTVIIKISAPIKSHFASTYNLNLDDLMGSNEYKEKYRTEMITWSDQKRKEAPGVFCASAVEMYNAKDKAVWIVSDVRRKSDVKWFKDNYGDSVRTIRMNAREDVRKARGWCFANGVDDVQSECDLDDYSEWDWVIENNGDKLTFSESLDQVQSHVESVLTR